MVKVTVSVLAESETLRVVVIDVHPAGAARLLKGKVIELESH